MEYVSKYNDASHKYTGPYAIVSWSGPRDAANNNAMHGNGRILFANGNTYEGGVCNDMLHGDGTLTDSENDTLYVGAFVEDKREGYAKFTHPFGIYEGLYLNNKRHGKGREVDNAGNIFEGQFLNGDAVNGKMTYTNGEIYIGEFKDDLKHGRGKLFTIDGDIREGLYIDDEFVGEEH